MESLDSHRLAKIDGEVARRVPRGSPCFGPGRQNRILAFWAKRLEKSFNRSKRAGLRNVGDSPRIVSVTGGLESKKNGGEGTEREIEKARPLTDYVGGERNDTRSLVDPASSHMLVSKIKPCMSQYKPL